MSKGREIRFYDYVNYGYDAVRDALRDDPLGVFQSATKGAASRAESIASELRVDVAGLEVGADIAITVHSAEEEIREPSSSPVTRLDLEWQASKSPRLFPVMRGELSVYPLTSTETQLDFHGHYEPPLGVLGGAVDTLVGHRIAEGSVHRFVLDVAAYLRETLGK